MLDLVGVGLSIGGKPILHDLNLHVLPGEIHDILGMNGTGKSTLASVIMGLSGFSPTSGNNVIRVKAGFEELTNMDICSTSTIRGCSLPKIEVHRGIRRAEAAVKCMQIRPCIHLFGPDWEALR